MTKLMYMIDAYLQEATATVEEVVVNGAEIALILDQTIFYPQGGGQPADFGMITGTNGTFIVSHVSYNGGRVLHKGKLTGELKAGDTVELKIDWQRRWQHIQQHTAGHLLDLAVKNLVPGIRGIDGDHGIGKRLSVTFDGDLSGWTSPDKKAEITAEIERLRSLNLPVQAEMVSYDEIIKRGMQLPFELPHDKPLRLLQIGEFPPMPDGGTHVHNTKELSKIALTDVVEKGGQWQVRYQIDPT